MRVLVFDLETDRLLCKTRDDHRDLRVTVGQFCSFDWDPDDPATLPQNHSWFEYIAPLEGANDLADKLIPLIDAADRVVAYNGRGFDLEVLRGCCSEEDVDRWSKKLRDPFEAIRDTTGSWVKLDELLDANALPFKKSGDGVSAVEWWSRGERRRVADYCRGDVDALIALITLDKIVFPIKTWRMQDAPLKPAEGGGLVSASPPAKRARSSVQVVTGWGELEWKPFLFGGSK